MSDGGDKIIHNVAELEGRGARKAGSGFSFKATRAARGSSQGGRLVLGVSAPEGGRSHTPDPGQGPGPVPPSFPEQCMYLRRGAVARGSLWQRQ